MAGFPCYTVKGEEGVRDRERVRERLTGRVREKEIDRERKKERKRDLMAEEWW